MCQEEEEVEKEALSKYRIEWIHVKMGKLLAIELIYASIISMRFQWEI